MSSFATSYIPTTASAVTRTADSAVMTGTDFSSWFNASEGTFVADFDTNPGVSVGVIAAVSDGTTGNFIHVVVTSGRVFGEVYAGGALQAFVDAGAYTSGTSAKAAFAFADNDFAVSLNGGAIAADTSLTLPAVTQLQLGAYPAGVYLNGHIRSLKFWPRRLPNTQLVGLTA